MKLAHTHHTWTLKMFRSERMIKPCIFMYMCMCLHVPKVSKNMTAGISKQVVLTLIKASMTLSSKW